jgi:hypothetical protein
MVIAPPIRKNEQPDQRHRARVDALSGPPTMGE